MSGGRLGEGKDEEEVHAAERWGIIDLARLRHPGSSPGTYNNSNVFLGNTGQLTINWQEM